MPQFNPALSFSDCASLPFVFVEWIRIRDMNAFIIKWHIFPVSSRFKTTSKVPFAVIEEPLKRPAPIVPTRLFHAVDICAAVLEKWQGLVLWQDFVWCPNINTNFFCFFRVFVTFQFNTHFHEIPFWYYCSHDKSDCDWFMNIFLLH